MGFVGHCSILYMFRIDGDGARYIPSLVPRAGMRLVIYLAHTGRRYWTGMGAAPISDKVLGLGMQVVPAPIHIVPFLLQ
jgi:hypothetical protein